MIKILSRGLFVLYIILLIWLVLFKFSFQILSVFDHHHRSLNLVPFAAPSIAKDGGINYGEMILNCIFFIPFGLLLNVNFKTVGFLPKLAFILFFSFTAEIIQYICAIGATDITDVITNTTVGLLGLALYGFSNRYINTKKLDSIIIAGGIVLLVLFISVHASHFLGRRSRDKFIEAYNK
jgi:glycopeptide antibiotics resistance protein